MAANDNKKNIGVIVYIIISVIVIVTLSLLLIFLKKCGKIISVVIVLWKYSL